MNEIKQFKKTLKNYKMNDEDYKLVRYQFFKLNEKVRSHVYLDSRKNKTVGIGFNMDRGEAKREWDAAFDEVGMEVPFQDVYDGNRDLSDGEIKILFDFSVKTREDELKVMFGKEAWKNKLRYNEKLAIEDIFYNSGYIYLKAGQPLREYLKKYVDTGNKEFLKQAVFEVKNNCVDKIKADYTGMQARRDAEAEMLAPDVNNMENIDDSVKITLNDHLDLKCDMVFSQLQKQNIKTDIKQSAFLAEVFKNFYKNILTDVSKSGSGKYMSKIDLANNSFEYSNDQYYPFKAEFIMSKDDFDYIKKLCSENSVENVISMLSKFDSPCNVIREAVYYKFYFANKQIAKLPANWKVLNKIFYTKSTITDENGYIRDIGAYFESPNMKYSNGYVKFSQVIPNEVNEEILPVYQHLFGIENYNPNMIYSIPQIKYYDDYYI